LAPSLAYGVGARRLFGLMELPEATSHTYNAEPVKTLSLKMRAKIAGPGGPLGHKVAIDRTETGVAINFLGEWQSADTLLGSWRIAIQAAIGSSNNPWHWLCQR
jgi:hypothetical protein